MARLIVFVLFLCFPAIVQAWDEADINALMETGICENCDLTSADLRWANVYAAELGGSPNLVDARMNGSDLSGANLYGANLEGAKLVGAKLTGANLAWTSLIGADLTGSDLADAKLTGAIFCDTVMPDGSRNNTNC